MKICRSVFGQIGPVLIEKISVTSIHDHTIEIINFGATVHSWVVKDRFGLSKEILLGRDHLQGYLEDHPHFGNAVGRFANRINKGQFELDGKKIQLSQNLNGHHLHGGWEGFGKKVWYISSVCSFVEHVEIKMIYKSPDEEEGYPGNLTVEITFIINNENELIIIHEAISDKNTICNLTNHCYFNLGYNEEITDHELKINALEILEINQDLIPTGHFLKVQNTPFDFSKHKKIDLENQAYHNCLEYGNGYDINYVLNPRKDYENEPAAELSQTNSNLKLSVFTSKPGLQLYTGNWLEGVQGRNNKTYKKYSGMCLEAQDFPDAPNHPSFPSAFLSKDQKYYHYIKYKIGTPDK